MPAGTIAIIGVGSVGASIAYTLMQRGLARRLLLVDRNADKARGEALDLEHCTPLVAPVDVRAVPLEEIAGSEVVIVTAGAKQEPGQTRLDLAETNVALFRTLLPEIVRRTPEAWLLIVSNPVDVLTYAALRLTGLPPRQVVGSGTVLDTARLRSLIARRVHLSPANIHAYVVGEHGDSEIAIWSSADAGAVPLSALRFGESAVLDGAAEADLLEQTRRAAGEVIAAKGATNWAISVATARILEAYVRDESAILTVSRLLDDYHGIRDVCLSVPSVISRGGVGAALPVPLSAAEAAGLRQSADAVRAVIGRLGLL
jgi:L-lactate dehydrogenase